jgi:hypothetical protein
MKFYFVGLAMRSPGFDYAQIQDALRLLNGRQVSDRIWMCGVNAQKSEQVFSLVRRCIATDDEMIVAEVPPTMRLPEAMRVAA